MSVFSRQEREAIRRQADLLARLLQGMKATYPAYQRTRRRAHLRLVAAQRLAGRL